MKYLVITLYMFILVIEIGGLFVTLKVHYVGFW